MVRCGNGCVVRKIARWNVCAAICDVGSEKAQCDDSRCDLRFHDGRLLGSECRGLHQHVTLCLSFLDRFARLTSAAHWHQTFLLDGFKSVETEYLRALEST